MKSRKQMIARTAAVAVLLATGAAQGQDGAPETTDGPITDSPSTDSPSTDSAEIAVAGPIEDDAIDAAIAAASGPTVTAGVRDPWEGLNRRVFAVNTAIDDVVFVPAAKAYRAVTPKPGRRGLRRFLANLRAPGVFINDVLQGEFGRAGETLSRFVVNSTLGAGGFADPAAHLGVPAHNEDFGQTLAVWGVPPGPFVVMPFFGPSTLRDSAAIIPQNAFDPLNYVNTPPVTITRFSRAGATLVSAREPLIEPLADIRDNSLDYYASIRSFYLQARQREINNGRSDFSDLPDIGDFEEFDDLE